MLHLLRTGLVLLTTLSTLTTPLHASHSNPLQQPLEPSQPPNDPLNPPHRIAIIGAGPAGSSTAHHLRHFTKHSQNLNITIFDSNPYMGGRTTTINALNDPRYPVELGASIFVSINEILVNATREFGLSVDRRIYEGSGSKFELGVWDGEGFVFLSSADEEGGGGWKGRLGGWWDVARLLWRYGLSPIRLRSLQKSVIGRFLRMYREADGFPFSDLTTVAEELDLLSVTSKAGDRLLSEAGISEMFGREIVQASSRVNYAQNLDGFQGLETMVCMSTEGAMSVVGGNWRIFEGMVKGAGAVVRLNTTVTGVEIGEDGIPYVTFRRSKSGVMDDDEEEETTITTTEPFDTIILAHPHDPKILDISPPPSHPRETPDYVTLHVTLLTTPHRPSPQFFDLDPSQPLLVPDTILTTLPSTLDPSFLGRGVAGLGLTPFWSLSTLRVLHPDRDEVPEYLESGTIPLESLGVNGTQYLYKIFSPEPVTVDLLSDLFGWELDNDSVSDLSQVPKDILTWHYEKKWSSYPYLPPRSSFESFDLYKGETGKEGRVWSTAPMEVFISTMETMALSGRNVARLVAEKLEGKSRAD